MERGEDTNGSSNGFNLDVGVEDFVRFGNISIVWDFEPYNVAAGLNVGEVLLNTSLLEALRPATKVPCAGVSVSLGCTQVRALPTSLPDDKHVVVWNVLGVWKAIVVDVVDRGRLWRQRPFIHSDGT